MLVPLSLESKDEFSKHALYSTKPENNSCMNTLLSQRLDMTSMMRRAKPAFRSQNNTLAWGGHPHIHWNKSTVSAWASCAPLRQRQSIALAWTSHPPLHQRESIVLAWAPRPHLLQSRRIISNTISGSMSLFSYWILKTILRRRYLFLRCHMPKTLVLACHGSTGPWVRVSVLFEVQLQRSQGDQLLVNVQALDAVLRPVFQGS